MQDDLTKLEPIPPPKEETAKIDHPASGDMSEYEQPPTTIPMTVTQAESAAKNQEYWRST
jgi:hypothetical protein